MELTFAITEGEGVRNATPFYVLNHDLADEWIFQVRDT